MQRLAAKTRRSADELALRVLGRISTSACAFAATRRAFRCDSVRLRPRDLAPRGELWRVFHRLTFALRCTASQVPDGRVLLCRIIPASCRLTARVIRLLAHFRREPPRMIRAMVEKWAMTLPSCRPFQPRRQSWGSGKCATTPAMGEICSCFRRAIRGIRSRSRAAISSRNRPRFHAARDRTGTPIVPIAVIGAEEQYVNLGNLRWAARALGVPSFQWYRSWPLRGASCPYRPSTGFISASHCISRGDAAIRFGDGKESWLVRQRFRACNRGIKARRRVLLNDADYFLFRDTGFDTKRAASEGKMIQRQTSHARSALRHGRTNGTAASAAGLHVNPSTGA